MKPYEQQFLNALMASVVNQITTAIKESEKNIMSTNQAALDAAIAALPAQIETAVETALAPVITAIQQAAAANGVDLTSEVTSLENIPATVSAAIATALTPAPAPAQSSTVSGVDATPAATAHPEGGLIQLRTAAWEWVAVFCVLLGKVVNCLDAPRLKVLK